MDSHFKMFPGVGTFTARGLTGGDAEDLGGHTDRAGDLDLLFDSNTLNIGAGYRIRPLTKCKKIKTYSFRRP